MKISTNKSNWQTKKLNSRGRDRYQSWLSFYKTEFESLADFRGFVLLCLDIKTRGNKAGLILNQGQRMIKLADNSRKLIKNRASFQVFFLIVCAESIIRIIKNQPCEKGVSQKNVIEFFENYFQEEDKKKFKNFFRISSANEDLGILEPQSDFKDIIKYFYKIRCKVAHQGAYWNFYWAEQDADMMNFIEDEDNCEKITNNIIEVKSGVDYEKIRPFFVRAIINAVKSIVWFGKQKN